jgi:ribose-phosphate pyrophosphokinase
MRGFQYIYFDGSTQNGIFRGDLAILAGSGNPVFAKRIAAALGQNLCPARRRSSVKATSLFASWKTCVVAIRFVIQGVHRPVNDNFRRVAVLD